MANKPRLPYAVNSLPFLRTPDGRRIITSLQQVTNDRIGKVVKEYADYFECMLNMDAAVLKCDAPQEPVTNV